jgi:hypothetical protein
VSFGSYMLDVPVISAFRVVPMPLGPAANVVLPRAPMKRLARITPGETT